MDVYVGVCVYAFMRVYIYLYLYLHLYLNAAISNGKRKMEAQVNMFTLCSSFKWKFVVCPFVDEETNRIYLFANGINGLNGLAHL
jgi:hypothetical protein